MFDADAKAVLDAIQGEERATRLVLRARIEELFGQELPTDLRVYVDRLEQEDLEQASNLFQCVDGEELASDLEPNAFTSALRHQIALFAAFTASVPIGKDGGGQWYYVALEAPHELGIYGPGVGELRLLADSFSSFLGLVRAEQQIADHIEEHEDELDPDAIYEGDETLDLSRAGLEDAKRLFDALKGHVRLTGFNDSDVCSDFDELFIGQRGGVWPLDAQSRLFADHERAHPLVRMLDHMGLWELEAECTDFVRVPDALYALWRLYFGDDDAALTQALVRCESHVAGMVRDAATFMHGLLDAPEEWAGQNHLRTLRELVLAGDPVALSEPPDGSEALSAADPTDSAAMTKFKAKVRELPATADAWDALTYGYFAEERWEEMHGCAEVSIALRPQHYYAWMQRGIARHMMEQYNDALADFNVGLCFGDHNNLLLNKAIAYKDLGRHKQMIDTLRALPRHSRRDTIAAVEGLAEYVAEVER